MLLNQEHYRYTINGKVRGEEENSFCKSDDPYDEIGRKRYYLKDKREGETFMIVQEYTFNAM
jgi:hypothetical protein